MDERPRLLDLFCGAGGAAHGYMQAGFHVTGIDIKPQPRYRGDVFLQGDALEYLATHGQEFDVIHASSPCQEYSKLKGQKRQQYPRLIGDVRVALHRLRKPFVIENVVGAPMHFPLLLCSTMFQLETPCGAQLRRHRLFESSVLLLSPFQCAHAGQVISIAGHDFHNPALRMAQRKQTRTITVTGSTPQQQVGCNAVHETFSVEYARIAMGIDWMVMDELSQAIPPAYTCWIGTQLVTRLHRTTSGDPRDATC